MELDQTVTDSYLALHCASLREKYIHQKLGYFDY